VDQDTMKPAILSLSLAALLMGCTNRDDDGPITMSVIGGPLKLADPARMSTDAGEEMMLAATAQGLVAFDASGQIVPALAERWIMTDDGMSFIFRIRRAKWTDGKAVTGREVAERLRTIMSPTSAHPLRPTFASVEQIIAMTGQVIEVRLRAPQPELLQLLAQPDMAIVRVKPTIGSGPYRIHSAKNGVTRLRPVPVEMLAEDVEDRGERDDVRVRGESARNAVARFQARETMLVKGGSFADLAFARAARPASGQFQVDPVYGLFGFAVVTDSKVLEESSVRRALAMAIDRERLVRSFGVSSWRAQYAALPNQLDSSAPPAALEWVKANMDERVARAKVLLAGERPSIRVALPPGPGSRLLFAAVAADWRRIGVEARAVGMREVADLRLIDEVAPQSAAFWYLHRLSCERGLPCDPVSETMLTAARSAVTIKQRGDALAELDVRLAERQVYIPLALPLRWSLVSPSLTGWRSNAFAAHPLRHLRGG
jgi:oligopeptide transport system substrate-binding protein